MVKDIINKICSIKGSNEQPERREEVMPTVIPEYDRSLRGATQFADDNARIAWKVAEEVSTVAKAFPLEEANLRAETIAFDHENEARGTYAIFLAGTVIGTAHYGEFIVPDRSLRILDRLNIGYLVRSDRQA